LETLKPLWHRQKLSGNLRISPAPFRRFLHRLKPSADGLDQQTPALCRNRPRIVFFVWVLNTYFSQHLPMAVVFIIAGWLYF
jgi:hypothetical protein